MKTDISALLDDELDDSEASRVIDSLRHDKELQEAWNTYHLIGDALRHSPEYSPNIAHRVLAKLEEEPVVFVPAARKKPAPMRFAMPLAAAVMGMAAVGWVALSLNATEPTELELAVKKTRPANEMDIQIAEKSPSGGLKEYLVAHQAHSPGGGIQGVASYVRTVSEIRQGNRR